MASVAHVHLIAFRIVFRRTQGIFIFIKFDITLDFGSAKCRK